MRPLRVIFALVLVGIAVSTAAAAPKKYHFKLAAVTAKAEVKADVAKESTPRVEAYIKKTFDSHPQLVPTLDGAPDPDAKAEAFRKFLKAKGLSGAYLVTVEITEASTEVVPVESKPGTQRLVNRIAVHILGETIPGRTMGFTGDGQATIKQEVGKKVRDRDKEFAWDSAAEVAIADAMKTVFKQLAVPPKKQ
jgi:hypothetical protein